MRLINLVVKAGLMQKSIIDPTDRVYRTGNKKNRVQKWQMRTNWEYGAEVLSIIRGTKYTRKPHNRKNANIVKIEKFGGEYFLPRKTGKISNIDWKQLTQCLDENRKFISYSWDGHYMSMVIVSDDGLTIQIRITSKDCVYEFSIGRC